jgi:hypothetical protein
MPCFDGETIFKKLSKFQDVQHNTANSMLISKFIFWKARKPWSLISLKRIAIFNSFDQEIITGSQMRAWCPSCEVVKILRCLY